MIPWKWIGNIAILVGLWQVGNKRRWAFLATAAGEVIWTIVAYNQGEKELCVMCVVFTILAIRNWHQWGKVKKD